MSEYQLELKQIVGYPRCRIYRQFIQTLISDRNIRTNGSSGLFYFVVLSSYANFRTSYRRIGGISYTIYPGEWVCPISEIAEWFRVRTQRHALSILTELQKRHLISYTLLGRGKIVKYIITDWKRSNRVLDYNAPCQKDTGFFFLSVALANEIISYGKCSEADIILDLWINAVYNDEQVQGSQLGPVVYIRNGTSTPLIGYAELAERWGISKSTVSRYLKKMKALDYLSLLSFSGTTGSVIYLKNYLSTMFQISDVMFDKEEIAMALNVKIDLPEDTSYSGTDETTVANDQNSVSKTAADILAAKVQKILAAQGFSCINCPKYTYKLLPLSSDCVENIFKDIDVTIPDMKRYLLEISCSGEKEILKFALTLTQKKGEAIHAKSETSRQ